MMINIFLAMLCAGVCTVFYRGVRFQKILSLLGAISLLGALVWVYHQFLIGATGKYSYSWLTSRYYPVDIQFFSDSSIYKVLLVLLFAAFLNMLYLFWDSAERQKLYIFALSCLNLASLLMLICGQNTIQILISICIIDILGFCLINNILARRQYIFYTLLADMAFYVACAMLWGNYKTNVLSEIAGSEIQGNDFALWLVIASFFIKSGLFPFQGYLMPTAVLSSSRRNVLYFLSTPLAGFFLLYKMQPILATHFIWFEYLTYAVYISLFWGAGSILVIKNLETKKLYLNLIFYSFAYGLILQNHSNLGAEALGSLYILQIAVNNSFNMSQKRYGIICLFSLLQVCAFTMACGTLENTLMLQIYLAGVVMGIGALLYEVSISGKEEGQLGKTLISAICAASVIYLVKKVPENFYVILTAYILLMSLKPYRLFNRIYDSDRIQQSQGFSGILYLLCVDPILFLGRILWLTIDFLIIERTLLSSLTRFNEILIRLFRWLHQSKIWNIVFFMLVGLAIILYCSYGEIK